MTTQVIHKTPTQIVFADGTSKRFKRAPRTFVMGDSHGGLKAIEQCLQRAKFNFTEDKLIVLGDTADGWPDVAESFDFLIDNVKNLVYVRGNHDQWLKEWLQYGRQPLVWTMQGGQNTLKSYLKHPDFPEIGKKHLAFLKKTPCYYLDEENRLFVHGGVDLTKSIKENTKRYLMWDRALWEERYSLGENEYREIYVGHTSIYRLSHFPLSYHNVHFLDTGGGWEGVLTIMDVDTKEFWQSDIVKDLYPEERGRN